VSAGRRKLLVPALSTAVMLVILLGLGTWQVRRLAWKEGILAQIAAAEAAPAVPLPVHPSPFAKVAVTGHLDASRRALFGAEVRPTPQGLRMGSYLIEPLLRPGEPAVLVDLGWVPTDPALPDLPAPAGDVTVDGFVRAAETPGLFSAADNVPARHFYTLDPAAMGAALGLKDVAPFTLIALGAPPAGGYPVPATHLPRPPNNHLQYAITWYALAGVLVVVFLFWLRETRS
jgi:surfeit locus 1 family protein